MTKLRERGMGILQRVLPEGVARRVAQNTGWLLGERILRLVGAFIVTIWMVRYLGPVDFGILAYGISVSLIVEVTAGLGVAALVVRDLVRSPEDEAELLGSALAMRMVAAVIVGLGALAFVWIVDGEPKAVAVVAIVISAAPFRALGTYDQAFQARMLSRLSVIARTAGFAVSALVKVVLLVTGAPLVWFAVAVTLEVVVAGIGYTVLYARSGHSPFDIKVRWSRARHLLAESWPLALAGAAAIVSLRIDQVMLRQMTDGAELGAYAAAGRLSEVWYFVPVALGTSLLPALVETKDDRAAHDRRLQIALDVTAWIAIAIAVLVTVFGGLVVSIYGDEYSQAADILRMQVWAGPFVFLGVISGRSLLARGMQRLDATRYLVGAPVNVVLNLILIPRYGAVGAAFATLVSYVVVGYFFLLIHPRTRHTGWLMTRAFLLPFRLREYGREYGLGGAGIDRDRAARAMGDTSD